MWNELKERPRRRQRVLKPYASINPRGEIVLNAAVFPHLEGNYYVALHYDDATGDIAITRPTWTGRVYNVKKFGRKKRLRVVRAMRFLNHLGLKIEKTMQFTQITPHPGGTLVLNLTSARRSPRRRMDR
ncbi:MAG: hypothetical protein KA810_03070 [Pyrinomonadaceae bacterium]|nr:hypothetical protein [Pyrinomonadaceae bacterium]